MKTYRNFDDIDRELNRLSLERQIIWEEIKVLKNNFQEDMRPLNWVQSGLRTAGKYGALMLLKRWIKR